MEKYKQNIIWFVLAVALSTYVYAADTDLDGMSDTYEWLFGLEYTNAVDAIHNFDSDSLINLEEFSLSTDPFEPDTDRDGWADDIDECPVSRLFIDWGEPLFTTGDDYEYTGPAWWISAFKYNGEWQTNSPAWHVRASEANDASLYIEFDPTVLTNDAVLAVDLYDHTNSTLYVDLYDTNALLVFSNLYGNILNGTEQDLSLELSLPLSEYNTAAGILMRRGSGEITIYKSMLYVDEDGDGLDIEQEVQFGTSDLLIDTDGDGVGDYDEASAFFIKGAAGFASLNSSFLITGSYDVNVSTPTAIAWSSVEHDLTCFEVVPEQGVLKVLQSGDYFIAVNVPLENQNASINNHRTCIRAEIYVNGVAADGAIGESSYSRARNYHQLGSDHVTVLLPNLSVDDEITVKVMGTAYIGDAVNMSEASLYAEYIDASRTKFFATTKGNAATNLQTATESPMLWNTVESSAGYTHGSSSQDITLHEAGDYLVFMNVPIAGVGGVDRQAPKLLIKLDGIAVPRAEAKQGYIRANGEGNDYASLHYFGLITTTSSNQVFSISSIRESTAGGTVLVQSGKVGSLYIEKIDASSKVYKGSGTTLEGASANWNPASASSIEWTNDEIIDSAVYSHSASSNSHQIVINEAGDYLLIYNDNIKDNDLARGNPCMTVEVNGAAAAGASVRTHYLRDATGHDESSGTLVFMLSDLSVGDAVEVSAVNDKKVGAVDDSCTASIVLIQKSSFSAPPANISPSANAGTDQNVEDTDGDGFETVTLDGSASYDPDGSIVSYEWLEGSNHLAFGVTADVDLSVGLHNITLIVTDDGGAYSSALLNVDVQAPVVVAEVKISAGMLSGVGDNWVTVDLNDFYSNMVVVVTPVYDETQLPSSARVRNAAGSSFDVKMQNPRGAAIASVDLYYVVAEAGVYTEAQHGVTFEAVKYDSTQTAAKNGWGAIDTRSYMNAYTSPVVLGQVMTANDPSWSEFFAYGSSQGNPPDASKLKTGKHVAEDANKARANETIGYIVFEAGVYGIGDGVVSVGVGADSVSGYGNSVPYSYQVAGVTNASVAVLSTTGVDGGDGGWPVLYGTNPVAGSSIYLGVDEDQVSDSERSHTSEQVAYLVIEGDISTSVDPDSDGDGMDDLWEQQIVDANTNDAINTVEDVQPNHDFDEDGVTNEQEYERGTDPTDPGSANVILKVDSSGGSDGSNGIDGPFATIGAAIDAAVSGDTVEVAEGVYNELPATYDFRNKNVTIISMGPYTVE